MSVLFDNNANDNNTALTNMRENDRSYMAGHITRARHACSVHIVNGCKCTLSVEFISSLSTAAKEDITVLQLAHAVVCQHENDMLCMTLKLIQCICLCFKAGVCGFWK